MAQYLCCSGGRGGVQREGRATEAWCAGSGRGSDGGDAGAGGGEGESREIMEAGGTGAAGGEGLA